MNINIYIFIYIYIYIYIGVYVCVCDYPDPIVEYMISIRFYYICSLLLKSNHIKILYLLVFILELLCSTSCMLDNLFEMSSELPRR